MAEPHSPRIPATAPGDGRSALGRAIEARDFKPYVHPGDTEPPAVTAARERHRAVSARIEAARAELDAQEDGDG